MPMGTPGTPSKCDLVDGQLADFALADKGDDLAKFLPYLGTAHGHDHEITVDPNAEVVCQRRRGQRRVSFVRLGCDVK